MRNLLLSVLFASAAASAEHEIIAFNEKGSVVNGTLGVASVIAMDRRGRLLHLDEQCFSDDPNRLIKIVSSETNINGDGRGVAVVVTTAGKCFYKSSGQFVSTDRSKLVYHDSQVPGSVKAYNVFRKSVIKN